MSWQILQGDCIERMAQLEEASIDAVVCDPPYGIDFMGKEWDSFSPARVARHTELVRRKGTEKASERYADRFGKSQGGRVAIKYDESPTGNVRFQLWCEAWAAECLRVLKPGGHLLACGGSRTHHRLVCGIEDAGFEIRDRIDTPSGVTVATPDGTLAWYFGSGFPKGKDVHKALLVMGAARCGEWLAAAYGSPAAEANRDQIEAAVAELEQPVEEEAWDGWNVALKPAHEPIVVARKPLIGTVAENVLAHGTGGINVDGCRIGTGEGGDRDGEDSAERSYAGNGSTNFAPTPGPRGGDAAGRWPANVVLDEEAAAELDAQTGELKSPQPYERSAQRNNNLFGGGVADGDSAANYGDSGGASRFFYCAKTSRAERNAGLEGFEEREHPQYEGAALNRPEHESSDGVERTGNRNPRANHHPTVKPINLMRWLVRLVTPPGGTVLDPFLGSGSTGCAAVLESFDFIGIEREAEYVEIAEGRIAFWANHVGKDIEDVLGLYGASQREAKAHADRGQGSIEDLLAEEAA